VKTSVDMRNMKHVFVGWVDMNPDAWTLLDYDTKAEWTEVINSLNDYLVQQLKAEYLPDRIIAAAKNKEDENAAGNDLYIRFSDVVVDKKYRLHLSIHFIDPKTNTEIATIPDDTYTGRVCGLVGCMHKSLNKVGVRLNAEMTTAPQGKK